MIILASLQCFASSNTTGDEISLKVMAEIFPTASRILPVDAPVPHIIAFEGREVLGYSFYTDLITPIPAYSGFPIRSLVSIHAEGTIISVRIIAHQEPILVIGVNDKILSGFIAQYEGMSITDGIRIQGAGRPNSIDGISGATITAMVLNRSVVKSAQKVLEAHTNSVADSDADGVELIDESPFWHQAWENKKTELIILWLGLFILVMILLFQDWVVVHPRFFNTIRVSFLIYTVVFIGYYCLGQLSIINVVTFIRLLATDFSWDTLLLDPIVFVLWGFVALSILLWGRGIFCGWLCPFGAIQELMHKLAQKLSIKPREFPLMVHERLLAFKYLVLIVLVGLSLNSIATAAPFLEIEPFKTAISLRFQREWYFVAYAAGLIAISLFTTKFYCRYICPLGAMLSFSSRFKIFNWLRRRPECGSVCHTCGNDCSVGAINNKGEIDESECHYCLECQTTYWDEHRCPVMVSKRARRERREKRRAVIPVKDVLE
jgi:NosR/NirI family nitrous oxide reductase transcriptional regulator